MAGIAGVCYASIVGSGTVTAGADSTMNAIAASYPWRRIVKWWRG